jgi:dTDP-4-dehydrorhamnose 3,5-epimerase
VAEAVPTKLEGLVAIEPRVFGDDRGFLLESFSSERWAELGVQAEFVQENHSRSTQKGTLRGLHFQTSPGQGKLVRAVRGAIFDVAVDLRRGSPTYGQWEGHVLDDETHRQLWIPVGFGHGFQVLSDVADVAYKLTSLYDPETEAGIAWDDPDVSVEWPLGDPLLSERDKSAPRLSDVADSLPF